MAACSVLMQMCAARWLWTACNPNDTFGEEMHIVNPSKYSGKYTCRAVSWLGLLVTSTLPRSIVFDTRSVHARSEMDKVALLQGFLPVLQFSPISNIPPILHTHSFTYHPHYIMFLSQYFSFPLSVSFHHCSILIHSSTTHAV